MHLVVSSWRRVSFAPSDSSFVELLLKVYLKTNSQDKNAFLHFLSHSKLRLQNLSKRTFQVAAIVPPFCNAPLHCPVTNYFRDLFSFNVSQTPLLSKLYITRWSEGEKQVEWKQNHEPWVMSIGVCSTLAMRSTKKPKLHIEAEKNYDSKHAGVYNLCAKTVTTRQLEHM